MPDISSLRKAAVILSSMPDEAAARLLLKLDPRQVRIVSEEIRRMNAVDGAQQTAIAEEFFSAVSLPQNVPSQQSDPLENVRRQIGAIPFGFLHDIDAFSLRTLLAGEQSQTIAVIICFLPPSQAAELIAGLSADQQVAVLQRLANIEQINPEIIRDLEKGIIATVTRDIPTEIDASRRITQIFSCLNSADAKLIFDRVALDNPDLADQLKNFLPGRRQLAKNSSGVSPASPQRRPTAPAKAA